MAEGERDRYQAGNTELLGLFMRLIEGDDAEISIELSDGKIRFTLGNVVLTSKLIDGTFPDYGRVIPQNNDKELVVDKKDFEAAVDRDRTLSVAMVIASDQPNDNWDGARFLSAGGRVPSGMPRLKVRLDPTTTANTAMVLPAAAWRTSTGLGPRLQPSPRSDQAGTST